MGVWCGVGGSCLMGGPCGGMLKGPPAVWPGGLSCMGWRWCPTLPHPGGCSTIGVFRLSFRVRNGTGRFPGAMTTATTRGCCMCHCGVVSRNCMVDARITFPHPLWGGCFVGCWPLVPVSSKNCFLSTSGLSTPWSVGGLHNKVEGELVLKQASRLDAFSGYPSRT